MSIEDKLIQVEQFLAERQISELWTLENYLKDIYEELSIEEGLTPLVFYEYLNLPLFLSNKLFCLFDKNKSNSLNVNEFICGFTTITHGSFKDISNLIWNFCDFNNKGFIIYEDMKLLFFYFFRSRQAFNKNVTDSDILKLIDQVLNDYYEHGSIMMTKEEFIKMIQTENSDLFFIFYIYLLKSLPFSELNINFYDRKGKSSKSSNSNAVTKYSRESLYSINQILIPAPSDRLNLLFDNKVCDLVLAYSISKRKHNEKKKDDKVNSSFDSETYLSNSESSSSLSNNIFSEINDQESTRIDPSEMEEGESNIQLPEFKPFKNILNEWNNIDFQQTKSGNRKHKTEKIKGMNAIKNDSNVENSYGANKPSQQNKIYKSSYELPSNIQLCFDFNQKRRKALVSDANLLQFIRDNNKPSIEPDLLKQMTGHQKEINFEGYIYKFDNSKNKLRRHYLVLMGKEMYYFKDSDKKKMKGMHYLRNFVSIKNDENYKLNSKGIFTYKKILGRKFLYFTLCIKKKEREFYITSEEEYKSWMKALKSILSVKNLNECYKVNELIYEGRLCKVFKGVKMDTKETVAVKIFPKTEVFEDEFEFFESIINEVDSLRIIRSQNVVKFFDFFEDLQNFYLITEFLERRDLSEFMDNNILDCRRKYDLIKQLCLGVEYLHSIGIMHRDLKPANVGVSTDFKVKILDFGFSKVMTNSELTKESYGTILFTAPEILLKQPYNKQIDIWSLGIIIYFIVFETLPMNTEECITKAFIQEFNKSISIPPLNSFSFTYRFPKSLEEILKLSLQKDASKRINISNIVKLLNDQS